ncbi:hypothetical protein T439DRAFT_320314 [Meredithblackwellia eburnea MCA 4105]
MSEAAEPGPSNTTNNASNSDEAWKQTRSGQRILELDEVEQKIARLMHLAGCTLASLHPDPLSSFTTRTSEDEDKGGDGQSSKDGEPLDKEAQFTKYAEDYYTTLNDIQISLRESIRHLRLSRASSAPLIDPHFGSLSNPGGGGVGVGGVAMGRNFAPLPPLVEGEGKGKETEWKPTMSVQALEQEDEAWKDLKKALDEVRKSTADAAVEES